MTHCRNMSAQDAVIHKTSPTEQYWVTKSVALYTACAQNGFIAPGRSLLTLLTFWSICTTQDWFDCPLCWAHTLSCVRAGKDVADRWYDEVKQYNFNRPGFSSGTGEIYTWECLFVSGKPLLTDKLGQITKFNMRIVISNQQNFCDTTIKHIV